jgi:Flp pilus assembly protein TadD
LEKIDEAIAIDAESNAAYRVKGRALHEAGRREEAVAAYRKALTINTEDAWSMNNLALVLIDEEKFDEALSASARAVELRDDVAVFYNNLGISLERTGHFRAAEDAYRSATNIDEAYEKASVNLVRVEILTEDPDLEPVDLGLLAVEFVEQIEGWSHEAAVDEESETDEADIMVEDGAVDDVDSTRTIEY